MNAFQITELIQSSYQERQIKSSELDDLLSTKISSSIEALDECYQLLLLKGKLVCDEYYQSKKAFESIGLSYGYINAYASQKHGTNVFEFFNNIPVPSQNKFIKKTIKSTLAGYTAHSFSCAAHDTEKELALLTESKFKQLREDSKKIKASMRKIRTTDTFKYFESN